jgi:hypothetical protein
MCHAGSTQHNVVGAGEPGTKLCFLALRNDARIIRPFRARYASFHELLIAEGKWWSRLDIEERSVEWLRIWILQE